MIFSQTPLVSLKGDKYLGNVLVRSSFQTSDQPATSKCTRTRCKTRPFICNVEKMSGSQRSHHLLHNSHFLQKVIHRQAGRQLGDRFREHLRDGERYGKKTHRNRSRDNLISPIILELELELYATYGSLQPFPSSRNHGKPQNSRTKIIQFQVGTVNPHGINERFSFN